LHGGEARAPIFDLVSNKNRLTIGEEVQLGAMVADGNTSRYAYSWFINEVPITEPTELNNPYIARSFSKAGNQVIRVVVSDMKGGVSSRSLILTIGADEKLNRSTVSGTVRSKKGLVQGARVVIEPAPVYEHSIGMSGDLYDSYYNSSRGSPAELQIDGQIAPDLHVRRGEIHRFYLDNTLKDLPDPLTFLTKPENAPPEIAANLIASPQVGKSGDFYIENPEVHYSINSTFSPYRTQRIGTYLDMLGFLDDLNSTITLSDENASKHLLRFLDSCSSIISFDSNHTNLITLPFARAIMQESNVSNGMVGPLEINELGYRRFGGVGYDRNQTPVVQVRRTSIWEDYNDSNATAQAFVDGVGTISPVISKDPFDPLRQADVFLGNAWFTRIESDPLQPKLPKVVVWGTGGGNTDEDPYREVNATVYAGETEDRYIFIYNQGKGFEPDGTMGVLHYPHDPYAYWTFDRHESLFENNDTARHQPSPAWNRQAFESNLLHHWAFNEANESEFLDSKTGLSGSLIANPTTIARTWGLMGRGLSFGDGQSITMTNPAFTADLNFTFSFWVLPTGDFSIDFSDLELSYNHSNKTYDVTADQIARPDDYNDWTHVAVAHDSNTTFIYVDGERVKLSSAANFFTTGVSITLNADNGLLLDECRVYSTRLKREKIRYLAGRTYLDLSGNKFHLVPMGSDFTPITPGSGPSSDDVPEEIAAGENGSGRLGDTYEGEEHGHSVLFNGVDNYLGLSSHQQQFALPEGSISLWVKVDTSQTETVPLLWLSSPFEINVVEDTENNVSETTILPGRFFAFELESGWPRIAGKTAFRLTDRINDGEWHHLVGTFPDGNIWIDGSPVETQSFSMTSSLFEGADNMLEFISEAESFYIGKAFDRTDNEITHYLNGKLDDFAIYDRQLGDENVTYLYELAKGREQTPRLEVLVDAIGSVEILDGGAGYRENPDLLFGFGDKLDKSQLDLNYSTLVNLENNHTENNTTRGTLAYVEEKDAVYAFHMGKSPGKSYNWRESGINNKWRKLTPAFGYARYDAASLGDLVWSKRMIAPVEIPLPDGRVIRRSFVDYVTMDPTIKLDLELNASLEWNKSYYKPNGLYGYVEQPEFQVDEPGLVNFALSTQESLENAAAAYGLYYLDEDANESREILFAGNGLSDTQDWNNSQIKIFGEGYKPRGIHSIFGGALGIETSEEDWDDDIEYGVGFGAKLDTDTTFGYVSDNNHYFTYDWNGSHDLGIDLSSLEFNHTLSSVTVSNPGFGYSVPIKLSVVKGFPQETNYFYRDTFFPYAYSITDTNRTRAPIMEYNFTEAEIIVTEVDENGSLRAVDIVNPGRGYVPYYTNPKTDMPFPSVGLSEWDMDIIWTDHPSGEPVEDDPFYPVAPGNGSPLISVTGGGGHGALLYAILDENGSVVDVGAARDSRTGRLLLGRGYFNIDQNNTPTAKLTDTELVPNTAAGEVNASLDVRLGGYIKEIPRCNACEDGVHGPASNQYSHLEPWVEIWDRGRPEAYIDQHGLRAHAAPKVKNGKIKKVVITNSGAGYIDPVVYIRDVSPKNPRYFDSGDFRRKWRCTFPRMTKDGDLEPCGHVHYSLYPPEECPGETDDEFPYLDENGSFYLPSGKELADWKERHFPDEPAPPIEHWYCEKNGAHFEVDFAARKCWGTKTNFILDVNDSYYRNPSPDWAHLDANLTVISKNGKIMEIKVLDEGANYFGSELFVEGTGSGVDAFPVFDEFGVNTRVILDDPKLKNLEFDKIERPAGAGQGFREKPWTWDTEFQPYYQPYAQPRDTLKVVTQRSQVPHQIHYSSPRLIGSKDIHLHWEFGEPVLADNLGDRILSVEIMEGGLYDSLNPDTEYSVTIEYNSTFRITGDTNFTTQLDFDGDGNPDFVPAEANAHSSVYLTNFQFDGNGSFDMNDSGSIRPKSLFTEQPTVQILDGRNLFEWKLQGGNRKIQDSRPEWRINYLEEDASGYIRLNGDVEYDPEKDKSYIEIYVDDRFPNEFYYGIGQTKDENSTILPKSGGRILVSEGLPGAHWFVDEPKTKPFYAYSDQHGRYTLGGLEPGMYNVAVFMEDLEGEESTFRPDANSTRVSQLVYLPGFPELLIETDNEGPASSNLVWSEESRELSRAHSFDLSPFRPNYEGQSYGWHGVPEETDSVADYLEEFDLEYRLKKELQGIGRGFDPNGPTPELTFIPHPDNLGIAEPNVRVTVLIDGSLSLQIIDDENTSNYFPNDQFYVRYSVNYADVDFFESNLYSKSHKTFGSGVMGSWDGGTPNQPQARLIISPGDGNGSNAVEVPLASAEYPERNQTFQVRVFDENGTELDANSSVLSWSLTFDFNATEGNNSKVAQILDPNGMGGLEANGSSVQLSLFSTLRAHTGHIKGFEVISQGVGYTNGAPIRLNGGGFGFEGNLTTSPDGNISGVDISRPGIGYATWTEVEILDPNTSAQGGRLRPIFHSGEMILQANYSFENFDLNGSVKIKPSLRNTLSPKEYWQDYYLDTFYEQNISWWEQELNASNQFEDLDDDNLTNYQEWALGTHPKFSDFDADGLPDANETNIGSSPFLKDTDGDGLDDLNEILAGGDPRLVDTDRDGLTDYEEWVAINEQGASLSLDDADAGLGEISARIYRANRNYPANFFLEMNSSSLSQLSTVFDANLSDFNGSSFPASFYRNGLLLDKNYSLRAFIDLDDDLEYDSWEPYAQWEGNLTGQQSTIYGIPLHLLDPSPDINFTDPQFEYIDINDSQDGIPFAYDGTAWTWSVEANDSAFINELGEHSWGVDASETNYTISVGGSFLPFLDQFTDQNFSRPPTISSTQPLPLGSYLLTYQAQDEWGNLSPVLEQNISVRDDRAPEISLVALPPSGYGLPISYSELNQTWIWPGGQASSFNFDFQNDIIVTDPPRQNATFSFELKYNNVDSSIDLMQLGDYNLTVQAVDPSGNESNLSILIKVQDLSPPDISMNGLTPTDGEISSLTGEQITLPTINVLDEFNASASYTISFPVNLLLEVNGTVISNNNGILPYELNGTHNTLYKVTPLDAGTYAIEVNATDGINYSVQDITLEIEDPASEIIITAVDGYLSGASLNIVSTNGLFSQTAETNASGSYIFRLSENSFSLIDQNGNNQIDFGECDLTVTGGIDLNTMSPFLGVLSGKLPNSREGNVSIVSPLSTLCVLLMDVNSSLSWEEAEQLVFSSLALDESLNLLTHDPFGESFVGTSSNPAIQIANLRLGSMMNSAEAFLKGIDASYQNGQIGRVLLKKIAEGIPTSIELSQPINVSTFEALLELAISDNAVEGGDFITQTQIESAAEIISELDNTWHRLLIASSWDEPIEQSNFFISTQSNFDEMVIQKLNTEAGLSMIDLSEEIISFLSNVAYPGSDNRSRPVGTNFRRSLSAELWFNGQCIENVWAHDADGDFVNKILISGNFDKDQDGQPAFRLSNKGKLCINDVDDIKLVAGQALRLLVRLDDGRGKYSEIEGFIEIPELTPLNSTALLASWYDSEWIGTFFDAGGQWLYHNPIGWLFYKTDQKGGYWFWDDTWQTWWWTTPEAFPWIYRDDEKEWSYIYIDRENIRIFDRRRKQWRHRNE
jgi:hypothetical protein